MRHIQWCHSSDASILSAVVGSPAAPSQSTSAGSLTKNAPLPRALNSSTVMSMFGERCAPRMPVMHSGEFVASVQTSSMLRTPEDGSTRCCSSRPSIFEPPSFRVGNVSDTTVCSTAPATEFASSNGETIS
jgi:hypothetical protein